MASPTKVLYLAFDACDPELLRELADAGEVPTFRHLFDSAAVAPIEPPPGVFISAVWPTWYTSLQPDRHDYLCWVQVEPGTYDWRETSPTEVKGTPFWDTLSEHGRRLALFDVPHSLISRRINGVQIVEWGCHDRHLGTASSPPSVLDDLDELIGPHPVGRLATQRDRNFAPCDFSHRAGARRSLTEEVEFFDDLMLGLERKEAASLWLLEKGEWDLFATVFGESHCAGHQFWHLHDPQHPWHSPQSAARLGDPLRDIYRRFDGVLANHLARVDDDTAVYVHLSHGMGAHYDGTHLIDIVLRRLDRADGDQRGPATRAASKVLAAAPPSVTARLGGIASPLLRRRIASSPPRPNEPSALPHAQRRWFEVPNNTAVGGVRLNVRGREPNGLIDPGRDFDRTCDWLAERLSEIVNVDTGEPWAREVVRSDSFYRRRNDDAMPDLFIYWNSSAPIERVYSPHIGTVVERYRDWRSGDHIPRGLLFVAAPGVAPGRRPVAVRTVDVSATLAAALDVDLGDVDGRVVDDLVPHRVPEDRAARVVVPEAPERLASEAEQALRRERTLERLATDHHRTRRLAERAAVDVDELLERTHDLQPTLKEHERRIRQLERFAEIRSTMHWIAQAEVPESFLVSVIMPTRNRATIVPRAIESVFAQTYTNWELVIVDDGSADDTPEVLAKYDDPRVRVLRDTGRGACAARNVALGAATGDLVVYLDDDNLMHPDWCKAVVWAFEQHVEYDVMYGARITENVARAIGLDMIAFPRFQFEEYDHEHLTKNNMADMGVLVHRAGLPEAHFDESLKIYGDWDIFWRLTLDKAPLALPMLACFYTTEGDGRLSEGGEEPVEMQQVRDKFARILAERGAAGSSDQSGE